MSWQSHRTTVLNSRVLHDVLKTLETYEVRETDESYALAINKKERASAGEDKSQYRIAKDLGKEYPSIVRALSKLQALGLIAKSQETEKGKRTPTLFVWTYKAVILFPDVAPVNALAGTYNRFFGDWNDCKRYFSQLLEAQDDEANAIMSFLCWTSRRFIRWVRDEILLPKEHEGESFPELEDVEYWRRLAIKFLVKEYVVYISEDPETYFREILSNVTKKSVEEAGALPGGFSRLLRFGESIFARKDPDNLRYIR